MSWMQPKPRRSAFGPTAGTGRGSPWQQPGGWGAGPTAPPGRPTAAGPFDAPPGPPPPGPPPGYRPPPPSGRRGPGPVGTTLLVVVPVTLVVLAIVGFTVLRGLDSEASSPPPGRTVGPPATTAGPTPTPTPTPTPSEDTSTWSSASYEPPSVDVSTTRPKRSGPYGEVPALTDSALYGIELGSWKCPALANPIAPGGKAFRGWMDGLVDCLMDRFGPAVTNASGTAMTRPEVVYYSGTVETPCGTMDDAVPYYCGSPQSEAIYVNPEVVRTYDDGVRLGAVQIIVHEFAHHVQQQFGLLTAGYRADVEDRLQVSRRVELQAECVSWSQTTQLTQPRFGPRDLAEFRRWTAMDQDARHGRASSYRYWFERIAGQGDLALCNTWVAAKKHVA